jgi:hypothetical protein
MKSAYANLKNMLPAALVALVLLASTTKAVANNENPAVSPVVVKYLGLLNTFPVFQVDLLNEGREQLVLTFKNPEGEVLYTTKLNDKAYTKKFQFTANEPETMEITLYVYSEKTKQTQAYRINKISRVIDDVVINKVRF